MATKVVDVYTPEIRQDMETEYTAAKTDADRLAVVKKFADMVGKSPASVRQIMTRAGYYVKKTYKKKTGGEVEKKEAKIEKIAAEIGLTSEVCNSLDKSTVKVLDAILARFAAYQNDIKALTDGEPEIEEEEEIAE